MTYDVVYIVREGKNNELIYSLRSVEKNFPYRRLIIYGGKPDGIEPDVYIRFKQEGATKWEKVRNTLIEVCQNDNITKSFWLFNDDFFVMQKIERPTNFYDGTLRDRIHAIEKTTFGRPSAYTKQLRHLYSTLKSLRDEEPLNYAHHTPMLIDRKLMLKTLNDFPDEPMFRALYGNINRIGGIDTPDVKFIDKRQPWPIGDFASTSDESWRTEKIGRVIREHFPKPSKWEKDNGRKL